MLLYCLRISWISNDLHIWMNTQIWFDCSLFIILPSILTTNHLHIPPSQWLSLSQRILRSNISFTPIVNSNSVLKNPPSTLPLNQMKLMKSKPSLKWPSPTTSSSPTIQSSYVFSCSSKSMPFLLLSVTLIKSFLLHLLNSTTVVKPCWSIKAVLIRNCSHKSFSNLNFINSSKLTTSKTFWLASVCSPLLWPSWSRILKNFCKKRKWPLH